MQTLKADYKVNAMTSCACSQQPIRIDGYTSLDFEEIFPIGLSDALEHHFGYAYSGSYGIHATPHSVYSFLQAFEADIALTLMNYGFGTVKEAMQFLDWSGHGWIGNYENQHSAHFACKNGIDVNDYLDVLFTYRLTHQRDDLLIDSLMFLRDCKTAKTRTSLACLISSGEVLRSHVEAVGYDLIKDCVDSEYLHKALKELRYSGDKWSEVKHTPADVRELLAKCRDRQDMLRRLKIMDTFDIRTASTVKHLGFLSGFHWNRASLSSECFIYGDNLFGAVRDKRDGEPAGQLLSTELIKGLFEGKVDIEFAAPLILKGEKTDRIVAMFAGVHTSMTEGWL
jgi:hypothetical protein